MAQTVDPRESLPAFVSRLQDDILPIYRQHELTFDRLGIHGRMHICRAVLFAEYMARFCAARFAVDLDLFAIRTAAAFHDSGRQGSGADLWEADSAALCAAYVRRVRPEAGEHYANYVGSLILKHGDDLCWQAVYDADVLEIMRPYCLNGPVGFKRDALRFLQPCSPWTVQGAEDLRERLIREAWAWIAHTGRLEERLAGSPAYMADLLAELARCRERFPRLATLL